MAVRSGSGPGVVLGLFLLWGFAPQAEGEVCYSKQSGFRSCSNGCCGPDDDQDCCNQLFLIVGLVVGSVIVVALIMVVIFCWVCKDCQPKVCRRCCGGGRRRGREERERMRRRHWRSTHARHIMVDPVQPPDYSTATQQRAPSVQPGRNYRIHPLSPPPPYIDSPPPPPTPLPQNSPRDANHKITTAAPSAASLPAVADTTGQSSNDGVSASSGQSAINAGQRPHQNGHSVFVVHQSSGSDDSSRSSDNSSSDTRLAGLPNAATHRRPSPAPESAVPNEAPLLSSAPASHQLLHVRESPRTGGSGPPGDIRGGSSQVPVQHGPDNRARGAALDTVSETGEGDDQLDLV